MKDNWQRTALKGEKMSKALEQVKQALADTYKDKADCDRCGDSVLENEMVTYGNWSLCEICQGDI